MRKQQLEKNKKVIEETKINNKDELLGKNELMEKIDYSSFFSKIHQEEQIKNTILNNYDKNYISNIEYTYNEFCNKFKEIENLSNNEISNNPKYKNIKDYEEKCLIRNASIIEYIKLIKKYDNQIEDLNLNNFDNDKFLNYKDKQEYLRIFNLVIQDFIYEIYLKFYDFMKYKEYFEIKDYDRFLDKIFKSIDVLKPFSKDYNFRQLLEDIPIHYTVLFHIFKNTLITYNIKEDRILQLFEALCEIFGINRKGFEYTKNLPKQLAIIYDIQLKNRSFSSFNYLSNIPWNNPKYKNYQL